MTDVASIASTPRQSFRRKPVVYDWNDERKTFVKERWATGASASEIGAEMGVTRNAVIGIIHRCREAGDEIPQRKASPVSRKPRGDCGGGAVKSISARKAAGGNNGLQINTPRTYKTFGAPPIVDAEIPAAQRRTLLELDGSCCHWPIGDPSDPAFFFCGGPAPAITGFPYCAAHSRVAYLPPNSRRGHMRGFY